MASRRPHRPVTDDRTPVIVGVAHEVHRPGPPEEVVDAITLMKAALRAAGDDAHEGAPSSSTARWIAASTRP